MSMRYRWMNVDMFWFLIMVMVKVNDNRVWCGEVGACWVCCCGCFVGGFLSYDFFDISYRYILCGLSRDVVSDAALLLRAA